MKSNKLKHKKHIKRYKSVDDKFALLTYFLIVIYLSCCELQRSILLSSQVMYSYVYIATLVVTALFIIILIVSKILGCSKAELFCLSFFNVSSGVLLLEKSLLYFLICDKFDFVTYFIYIYSTLLQLVFAIYRMFKVKETMRIKTEASEIFKSHDEHKVNSGRGDIR